MLEKFQLKMLIILKSKQLAVQFSLSRFICVVIAIRMDYSLGENVEIIYEFCGKLKNAQKQPQLYLTKEVQIGTYLIDML